MRRLVPLALMAALAAGPARSAARAHDWIGINQWVDDWDNVTMSATDTARVADWIRWYTYMEWTTTVAGEYHFAPTLAGGGPTAVWKGFDFDDWFGTWKRAGLKVLLCLNQPPAYCSSHHANGNKGGPPNKYPACGTEDGTQPWHYAAYADWVRRMAARYGRSGSAFVDAFEIWNEPNLTQEWSGWRHDTCPRTHKDWCDRDVEQYAACLKAAYVHAKKGDVTMPVGGGVTAGFDEPYFDGIKAHGGLDFMNAVAFHGYEGGEIGEKGAGRAPEYRHHFRLFCQQAAGWRDRNAPGLPLWLTEIGWDAWHETKRPPTFIGATLSEQANWLVRSFVIGAEYLDRIFWFIAADGVKGEATIQFDNCGIVRAYGTKNKKVPPSVVPKPAFWAMALMKREIGGLAYAATLAYNDDGAFAYLFRDPASRRGVIVAWCADTAKTQDSGKRKKAWNLYLMGGATTCTQVAPKAGSFLGSRTPLPVRDGSVRVNLSETPIYLELDEKGG